VNQSVSSVIPVGSSDPECGSEIRRRRGAGVRKEKCLTQSTQGNAERKMNLQRQKTEMFCSVPFVPGESLILDRHVAV
jgi:hypothetical protein